MCANNIINGLSQKEAHKKNCTVHCIDFIDIFFLMCNLEFMSNVPTGMLK